MSTIKPPDIDLGQYKFGWHDPANYVYCGFDPWDGWQKTKEWSIHFHIKDWKKGAQHGSLAGEGEGRIPEVIADAVKRAMSASAKEHPEARGR